MLLSLGLIFFKIFIYLFIYYHFGGGLRQVLVAVRGIFVAVHGLLSICGVQGFLSLFAARGLQGTWAL